MTAKLLVAATVVGGLLAACERSQRLEVPTCDANATAITDTSIGPLYLGESAAGLRARCAAVLDTSVIIPMTGWVDTVAAKRLVVVGVPVLAIYEGDRVTALRVASPGLQTVDSITVGTSIARFRNKLGIRVSPASHSPTAVLRDRSHCGMIFELSSWGAAEPVNEGDPPLTGSRLATWPDSITVSGIVVTRCAERSSSPGVDSAFDAQEDSISKADALTAQPLPAPGVIPPSTPSAPVVTPPPTVTTTPARRGDTTSITATPSELAELRKVIDVPVQGITRAKLRDTYAEARGTRTHEALDIPAARGTPALSAADGKLLKLFSSKQGGLMVYASDPSDRFILLYGHLDRYADGIREGMPLKRGQVIGYVGTTGNAPIGTPHLHFAVLRGRPSAAWWRGTPVNPFSVLVP
jgi:peptidoglycan LD-endopeptidase LytH